MKPSLFDAKKYINISLKNWRLVKINWWFDVTNKIFGTKKLPLMIIPKNATFYVLPNCLLHQCLKEKWKWKYSFRNYLNLSSVSWWPTFKRPLPRYLKISKNRNDFMKTSFLRKTNEIIVRISSLWYSGQKSWQ